MNKMIHDTENCHWRDARWFEQNRGVSRYTLKGHNEAGRVRSFKGGSAIQSRRVKMRLQNGYISAEVPFAVLRYVPDVGDRLDEWPVWFTDAVVAELAYRISGGITGSVQQRNLLKGIAAERLAAAIKIDASETGWSGTDGRTFARARS